MDCDQSYSSPQKYVEHGDLAVSIMDEMVGRSIPAWLGLNYSIWRAADLKTPR